VQREKRNFQTAQNGGFPSIVIFAGQLKRNQLYMMFYLAPFYLAPVSACSRTFLSFIKPLDAFRSDLKSQSFDTLHAYMTSQCVLVYCLTHMKIFTLA
jgi:hypothetical protein